MPGTDLSPSNIVRLCWANTLKLYKVPLFCYVHQNHYCIPLFSFEQRLITFYLASKILILDKLRIFKMKTSLFKNQQRLLENYKNIAYYSPFWGCAGDLVEMVVKCIVGLFWGTNFQQSDKFVAQNSPTIHFDNNLHPVYRAAISKWWISDAISLTFAAAFVSSQCASKLFRAFFSSKWTGVIYVVTGILTTTKRPWERIKLFSSDYGETEFLF